MTHSHSSTYALQVGARLPLHRFFPRITAFLDPSESLSPPAYSSETPSRFSSNDRSALTLRKRARAQVQRQSLIRQAFSPPPSTGTRVSRVSPACMRSNLQVLNLPTKCRFIRVRAAGIYFLIASHPNKPSY